MGRPSPKRQTPPNQTRESEHLNGGRSICCFSRVRTIQCSRKMSTLAPPISRIIYPDTDGKPMAENTLQYDWIVKITGGLRHLFADNPNVFVAGDLFWYPVEGHPEIRIAPDSLIVFGRPPGAVATRDEGITASSLKFDASGRRATCPRRPAPSS